MEKYGYQKLIGNFALKFSILILLFFFFTEVATAQSAKIYSYKKVTDKYTTWIIIEPDYEENQNRITELCTIDNITYVSVPDGVILPNQPKQVSTTLQEVILTDELKKEIQKTSPHVKLIRQRVKEQIRKKISLEDELELLRLKAAGDTSVNAKFIKYHNYVTKCKNWGIEEMKKLGLD